MEPVKTCLTELQFMLYKKAIRAMSEGQRRSQNMEALNQHASVSQTLATSNEYIQNLFNGSKTIS